MKLLRMDGKLWLVASALGLLVTCQTVILGQLSVPSSLDRPQAIEKDCRTAEQPPWIDTEPSRKPCPFEAASPDDASQPGDASSNITPTRS
jgi:hypothetical protein